MHVCVCTLAWRVKCNFALLYQILLYIDFLNSQNSFSRLGAVCGWFDFCKSATYVAYYCFQMFYHDVVIGYVSSCLSRQVSFLNTLDDSLFCDMLVKQVNETLTFQSAGDNWPAAVVLFKFQISIIQIWSHVCVFCDRKFFIFPSKA